MSSNPAGSGINWVVVGPVVKIRPKEIPGGDTSAILFAARNEFEAFQIAIWGGQSALQNVSVFLTKPLTGRQGTIPADNVTIYREAYYTVVGPSSLDGLFDESGKRVPKLTEPVRWPDPLVPAKDTLFGQPRHAFPIPTIPAGENRVAWIDILVPMDAARGTYAGTLRITAGSSQADVPVCLTVFNATLPPTSTLKSAFLQGFDAMCLARYGGGCIKQEQNEELGWQLTSLCARLGLNNRVTFADVAYQPIELDQANTKFLEQYALPLLNGKDTGDPRCAPGDHRLQPLLLSGATLTTLHLQLPSGPNDPQHPDRVNKDYLAFWQKEAKDQGFTDRCFVYQHPCGEPDVFGTWPQLLDMATDIRSGTPKVWTDVPILVTAPITSVNLHKATDLISWLAPVVNYMDGSPTKNFCARFTDGSRTETVCFVGNQRPNYDSFLQQSGKELWLYTSCLSHGCEPNHAIEANCQCSPTPKKLDPMNPDDVVFTGWPGYAIDAPALEARAMGWVCFLYDASGEFYFDATHCTATDMLTTTAWTAQYAYGGNGDGTLLYPGDPKTLYSPAFSQEFPHGIGGNDWIPLEPIRLKLIRDGYEDYEYLNILKDRGQGDAAKKIIREQLLPNLYSTNLADVDADAAVKKARLQLAQLIDPMFQLPEKCPPATG